jgi:hypothetical protein
MISRFWPVIAVLLLACVAAAALWVRTPPAPSPAAAAPAVPITTATIAAPVAPAEETSTAPVRQPAGYDHYRAEMKRIRAEREKAQALEANERCIGRERYRKVGSAWERVGNC